MLNVLQFMWKIEVLEALTNNKCFKIASHVRTLPSHCSYLIKNFNYHVLSNPTLSFLAYSHSKKLLVAFPEYFLRLLLPNEMTKLGG